MVHQRLASPYEKRLAIREDLGYFHTGSVGAVYEFADGSFQVNSARSFAPALKSCIAMFPQMAMIMKGKDTKEPFWELVPSLNLDDHISVIDKQVVDEDDETAAIERALPSIVDQRFTDPSVPPWRIVILPFTSGSKSRCFIAYVSSHSTADGVSGYFFHRKFLEALQKPVDSHSNNPTVVILDIPLPEAFDTPERFPISPEFMKSLATTRVVDENTWTGSPVFLGPNGLQTGVKIIEIGASQVKGALNASRAHGTKLTGLLHKLVVRALTKALPGDEFTNFVSQTAVDLRMANGTPLIWGNCVSGLSYSHPRIDPSKPISDKTWADAKSLTEKLSECSSKLEDQMIGMIRFVPDHAASMMQKLGGPRDASFALSNINAFDGVIEKSICKITKFLMTTSAAVHSAPFTFCIASVKGGNLICVVTWQKAALGCPLEDEATLLDNISSSIKNDFENMSA
ncbi:Alcohol acetyltransferase [Talaromyces marneffei ATCC 18224]|uniref:Alcohol acetyltransferase n=1 Tax=Talaromyces marneffei (strain ATCC 18224 / CBS 334.59 / QM 7333) TaxID=441960 RepID=B6QUJ3_TALMQ|nr:conserved hypothetical protein [Talaromyces marneffei ATCC 18224]